MTEPIPTDHRTPAVLAQFSRVSRRHIARTLGVPWSDYALPQPPKSGPNRAKRRAAMQADGPFRSQFGLRNDEIRRDAQKRAAETIRARAEAAAERGD